MGRGIWIVILHGAVLAFFSSSWAYSVDFLGSSFADGSARIGVHGGASFANVTSTPAVTTDPLLGSIVGVSGELELVRAFSLSLEINYLQKGFRRTEFDTETRHSVTYLDLPLLVSYRPWRWRIRPLVQLGPSFAVRLSAKSVDVTDTEVSGSVSDSTFSHFDPFNLHFGAGLEYQYNDQISVALIGRYMLGISTIYNEDDTQYKNVDYVVILGPKIAL